MYILYPLFGVSLKRGLFHVSIKTSHEAKKKQAICNEQVSYLHRRSTAL